MKVESILENWPFQAESSVKGKSKSSFQEVLESFLSEVNQEQLKAREVERALAEGKVKSFEEALFVVEKAELSLRLLTELRNKALESYQEIMRMQV